MKQNFGTFRYQKKSLHCEDVSLEAIGQKVGTPCYIYSHDALVSRYQAFDRAFAGIPHLICFAMKANSNQAVLRTFINQGAGIDIVSGGELYRALQAGADPQKIVYAGVGKTADEIKQALQAGILQFNVESEAELHLIDEVAQKLGVKAPFSLRVNPNINPKTHPYISTGLKESKFGIPYTEVIRIYKEASRRKGLKVQGITCHIGSQITTLSPFQEAMKRMIDLIQKLKALHIDIPHLDFGGGLGITYKNETPPEPKDYARVLKPLIKQLGTGCRVLFEPGRFLVGNAGVLLTKVIYRKVHGGKKFVIVDAAMNDLIRPALYESHHEIWPTQIKKVATEKVTIVGPVCESGDFFASGRPLPQVVSGDTLAILSAGAYGASMSSRYNSRTFIPEVMVNGGRFDVVREKETYADMIRNEKIPSYLK